MTITAQRTVQACGLVVVALASMALVGWMVESPILAALGYDLVPMAPSTAVLFLLFGVGLLDAASRPRLRRATGSRLEAPMAVALTRLGMAVAAVLLLLSTLGIATPVERLGLPPLHEGTVAGAPVGHMSPLTAACFLLAGIAFLALLRSPERDWQSWAALALAAAVVTTSAALIAAYALGGPLLYGSEMIPPTLNTSLAFLFLATGLVVTWVRLRRTRSRSRRDGSPAPLLVVSALFGIGLLVTAYAYFHYYQGAFRQNVEARLSGIAALKVSDISHWRQERLGDAEVFAGNRHFGQLIAGAFEGPGRDRAEADLREWLDNVRGAYDYERISLLDATGTPRLSVPGPGPGAAPTRHLAADARRTLETGRVHFLDFHRDDASGRVHLHTLVPIFHPAATRIGALVLRIDPRTYLYPMLQRWPTPSASAETLLVRRDGDDVLFLNELRFREDAALNLRIPLLQTDVPAVMAVRGARGVVEGIDYRGVPVVAAVQAVPDSPWFLVARIDQQEIYAPLRAEMWWTVGIVGALLLGLGAAVAAAWQRRTKHHYRAVAEQEERYRTLFETMAVGAVHIDTDAEFLVANPAAERILGRSIEEMRELPMTDPSWGAVREDGSRLPDEEFPAVKALRTGEEVTGFTMGFRHPGTDDIRWLLVNARPEFRRGESEPHGVLVTFADITARKRAEEHRERLQAELGQAQKMESVGRLAGGVAHDFNNMLSVILGNAEMAMQQLDEADPAYDDLRNIRQAAERSAELTRQLLAFARRQTIAPEVLDLNETVEAALKMLRRLVGEEIDLSWRPAAGLWPVRVDPAQVDQILANLIVNARDAIDSHGTIVIRTENVVFDEEFCDEHAGSIPGPYACLCVRDDGQGMAEETAEHAFDPFFTTKSGEGTGLGLSTVYGIVKQNEGFVYLDTAPGEGTQVRVYLPRCEEAAAEGTEQEKAPVSHRGEETILLVEDEAPVLQLTTRILERLGYTVLSALTPGQALRLAKEHPGRIDLLLTDVVMPEMNGRELAERLRAAYPRVRVLYMSGYPANVLTHRGTLDEGVHLIQKPFSTRSLAATIREMLD